MNSIEESQLVPARILNEYAYCPRLAYLEWVHGEFRDSVDTVEGTFQHRRVDVESGNVAGLDEGSKEQKGPIRARSVMLSGQTTGLIAKIDLVESDGDRLVPIDYKHGKVPDNPERSWEPERVQLCAQGLILNENGYESDHGVIYYVDSKTRVVIRFDEGLKSRTLALLEELKKMGDSGEIPAPLVDSPKCNRCSLAGICLPDEVNFLQETRPKSDVSPRRLVPALADQAPVYVQEQGAMVSKRGDVIQIKLDGKVMNQVRMMEISQLSVFGNVQISTQLLRELAEREIPVCYFTYGGWFKAILSGFHHKNIELRCRQHQIASEEMRRVVAAREFVSGKIKNCRTMLRRNHPSIGPAVLAEMNRLASRSLKTDTLATLLGLEGAAARLHFSNFGGMLKGDLGSRFEFESRNRRPPRDPVNAILSLVYSLLAKDLFVECLSVGFDPLLGFLHQTKYGKPALALDLAEEFRPLIGDSVALTVINGGEVCPDDFISRAGVANMTPSGRKAVISAYERRLASVVQHPVFGYSIGYRRVFEVQARLLSRWVMGEIDRYPAFTTR